MGRAIAVRRDFWERGGSPACEAGEGSRASAKAFGDRSGARRRHALCWLFRDRALLAKNENRARDIKSISCPT